MKALVDAFNQEKALVGAFSVIVKNDCETDGALHSTRPFRAGAKRHLLHCAVAEAESVHTFERGFLVTSILCPGSAAPRQDHDSDTGLGTNILLCNSWAWLGPGS